MEERDRKLWVLAKKRVRFKKHLATYIIINAFLWALWWITDGHRREELNLMEAWPVWCSLG